MALAVRCELTQNVNALTNESNLASRSVIYNQATAAGDKDLFWDEVLEAEILFHGDCEGVLQFDNRQWAPCIRQPE
jgi:hypothetical protein